MTGRFVALILFFGLTPGQCATSLKQRQKTMTINRSFDHGIGVDTRAVSRCSALMVSGSVA